MRLIKRAGILFLAIVAVVAGMVMFGIVTRGSRQLRFGFQPDDNKRQPMPAK